MTLPIVSKLRECDADLALEAAAMIEKSEAALTQIAAMCPVTCDMTSAHEMAGIAEETLAALKGE